MQKMQAIQSYFHRIIRVTTTKDNQLFENFEINYNSHNLGSNGLQTVLKISVSIINYPLRKNSSL